MTFLFLFAVENSDKKHKNELLPFFHFIKGGNNGTKSKHDNRSISLHWWENWQDWSIIIAHSNQPKWFCCATSVYPSCFIKKVLNLPEQHYKIRKVNLLLILSSTFNETMISKWSTDALNPLIVPCCWCKSSTIQNWYFMQLKTVHAVVPFNLPYIIDFLMYILLVFSTSKYNDQNITNRINGALIFTLKTIPWRCFRF